jgi:hypothetical protein
MSTRATTGPDNTGHSDSPRQDTQRPEHSEHADAGGQESTARRSEHTQRPAGTRPAAAPPVPGQRQADPPLPSGGRQPERPGQSGRAEDHMGWRDTLVSTGDEGGGGDEKPRRPGR